MHMYLLYDRNTLWGKMDCSMIIKKTLKIEIRENARRKYKYTEREKPDSV